MQNNLIKHCQKLFKWKITNQGGENQKLYQFQAFEEDLLRSWQLFSSSHSVTSQKTYILNNITVRTSNCTSMSASAKFFYLETDS